MRQRRAALATLGTLVALALVAGPLALSRQDDPAGPPPRLLAASESTSRDRDIRPEGASIGDEFLLRQVLREGAVEVGRADITCSYVRVLRERPAAAPIAISIQCLGTARIGEDALTYQGLNSFAPDGASVSRFAVTGGTGAFDQARGEVRVTETGPGTSTYALDLTGVEDSSDN